MKKLMFSFLILALLFNCGNKKDQSNPSATKDSAKQQSSYVVEQLDEAGLDRLIQQRNGKFLFLNVWATWCPPCREEFPDLVRLASDSGNTNVEFVGLSVDFPDEIDSRIVPFLEANRVNFKIYVQNFQRNDRLINVLNENWNGAIPATFIFNADGKQVSFILGKRDYQDFKKEIDRVTNL